MSRWDWGHAAWRAVFVASLALALGMAPPALAQSGQAVGGGIGAVVGGVLGNALGRNGSKRLTAVIGAAAGAFIGSRIAKGLSKRDQEQLAGSTQRTIETGQAQTWVGSKKGISGRTEVTGTDRRSAAVAVPVLKERVTELPPLDFINANYELTRRENVRGGPGTDYRQVSALKKGDVVTVTGRVQDKPWYLIAQDGVGMGFVPEQSMRATSAAAQATAALLGTVEQKTTELKRPCRTIKQTVSRNGKEESETVTACQTPGGTWELA